LRNQDTNPASRLQSVIRKLARHGLKRLTCAAIPARYRRVYHN